MLEGLKHARAAAEARGARIASVGVDTWGIDYALLGRSGQLLAVPWAHRDERFPDAMRRACDRLGAERIYQATGIQFLPFNTLFQLMVQQEMEPGLLELAHRLINTPDLLHYFLTGEAKNEATVASTTQMLDTRRDTWATDLMQALDLPTHFLEPAQIIPPGSPVGPLSEAVAQESGIQGARVHAPASHDTASAVAAVPAEGVAGGNWAYLSSGTWSLMGAELAEPVITAESSAEGFTNERGALGTTRFLKNIAGLWLVQECRRALAQEGQDLDYAELTKRAASAEPFRTIVDPNHEPFLLPGDMPQKLQAFARRTDQPEPNDPGELVRCCLESLALFYRRTMDGMERVLNKRFEVLHIVGGGAQNELLNQMTADALGRPVTAGPHEATALGNALTQALGTGAVSDLAGIRALVRESVSPKRFEPQQADAYEAQLERFDALTQ
jgi:rhamnulokinase